MLSIRSLSVKIDPGRNARLAFIKWIASEISVGAATRLSAKINSGKAAGTVVGTFTVGIAIGASRAVAVGTAARDAAVVTGTGITLGVAVVLLAKLPRESARDPLADPPSEKEHRERAWSPRPSEPASDPTPSEQAW